MPRHRSLNLKKFIDSIPDTLIEEYFRRKFRHPKAPLPFKTLDYDSVNNFLDTIQDEDLLETLTQMRQDCMRELEAYSIFGQKVATLVGGTQKAGYEAVTWNAKDAGSGVYLYRLQAGSFVKTRRMVVIK